MRRKLYSICYWPTPLNDRKRTNITGRQFSTYSKPLNTSHWRHPKVNMIINFKYQRPASLICIALLAGLCGFQICLYKTNLVFGLTNYIGPKEISFTSF